MPEPQNIAILVTEANHPTKRLAPAVATELWQPGEGEVRIRVEAAAQNPTDWKQLDYNFGIPGYPFVLGVDVSGVVDALGAGVTKFKLGDRVASMTRWGRGAAYGVYQRYCLLAVEATVLVPDTYSFDEAATLPLAYWTAAVGLYSCLQIPIPLSTADKPMPKVEPGETLLVWGGSSSVGALAVQLGVISGFRVISTASPRNFEFVKSLGAEKVLDYHDADIVDQIRELAPNLRYAYDAISENGSTESTLECLSHSTPEAVIVLEFKGALPAHAKVHNVLAGIVYFPGHEAELESLTELWAILMQEGKIQPNPVKIMPDGLNSIDEGFDMMRRGKVSGQKLVYHPWETKI